MNKIVLVILLSSSLIADNILTDLVTESINKGVDKALENTKEKMKELGADWKDTSLDGVVSGKIWDATHNKKGDPYWGSITKDSIEDPFEESIDQFLKKFHSTDSSLQTPFEIHFQKGSANANLPLLTTARSITQIPTMSLEDRPVDYIGGGLKAAKTMKEALESCYSDANPLYRHLVALETTSPLLGSVAKQILTWANQLNALSITSYDLASIANPGLWPKIQRSVSYACEHELIAKGVDLLQARTLCQQKTTRDQILQTAAQRNPQIFTGSFNVADKVLSLMGIKKEKNLLINLTGTLVSTQSENIAYYPSLYKQVIALLETGTPIEKGYNVSHHGEMLEGSTITIGFKPQKELIFDLLKSIQQKLKEDIALSEEEKKLLGHSHFPLASFISVMTQYREAGSSLLLERISHLIAFDRVVQFVEETLQNILYKCEALRSAQIAGYELDAYITQVRSVFEEIQRLKGENSIKIESEQKAIDALLQMEKELRKKMEERS